MVFFGPTSAASFLSDAQVQPELCLSVSGGVPPSLNTTNKDLNPPDYGFVSRLGDHHRTLALFVGTHSLPTQATIHSLININGSPVDGWIRPVVIRLSDSIWETFKIDAKTPEITLSRAGGCYFVCAETLERHLMKQCGTQDWAASFSALNVRWESLGIFLLIWHWGYL